MTPPIIAFFDKAKKHIVSKGYQWEINLVQNRRFENMDAQKFAWEFLFCALGSSGLNNKVVQKQYDRFEKEYHSGLNAFETIPNHRIQGAVLWVWGNRSEIFRNMQGCSTDEERVDYIKTFPQMGPKTSLHFARNIGLDFVKPDIWMERLAEKYNFITPDAMCKFIQWNRPENRVGTVDVILWRYCNLTKGLE